jgi:hypothetical protein
VFLVIVQHTEAFSSRQLSSSYSAICSISTQHSWKEKDESQNTIVPSRRSLLSQAGISVLTVMGVISTVSTPASAKDELFKPNPLTNPVLEQIRIWEQAEADNIKYGGELEMGDAGNKGKVGAYPSLLVPILKIDQELVQVKDLVHDTKNVKDSWSKALSILQHPTYDKITFKKTFNKYGDNIYYSDPDRANLYLGGGATPKTEQSLAYLLRNELLTNIENLRAELEYLLKTGKTTETEDLYQYADVAISAMKKYLAIVPPNELVEAQKALKHGEYRSVMM